MTSPRAKDDAAGAVTLHGRLWLQRRGRVALTDAGADLLQQIDALGSLSKAAKRLHFSYRRAWMLIDAMNRRWPAPLVKTAIGGTRGGGATLTPLGRAVLASYRDLQVELEALLDRATPPLRRTLRSIGR